MQITPSIHNTAFTGKETDCETGFSYFGARYYDPTLLTGWTAVDPMSDKYLGISPYAYCNWNPVKLVDPDGMEYGDYYDQKGKFLGTDGINDGKIYTLKDGFRAKTENKSVNWGGKLSKVHSDQLKKYSTETTYKIEKSSKAPIGGGLSVDVSMCLGIGVCAEFGIMVDQEGSCKPFVSRSNVPSVGLEASIGLNLFTLIPKKGEPKSMNDYTGDGYGVTANLGFWGAAIGGDRYYGAVNERYNDSFWIVKGGFGLGIGGSLSQTTTKILEWEPILEEITKIGQTYWK